MHTFTAHRLSSGNNTVFPDRIEINSTNIIYFKGYIFGYKRTILPRNNIASVTINAYIIFADVLIESFGGDQIIAHGFLRTDAKSIVRLLT